MATYTRTQVGAGANLVATAAAGGALAASTQYWFVVLPMSAQYKAAISLAIGTPTNIATATTDATNKAITLTWDAVPGAAAYQIMFCTTNPGTDPEAFNTISGGKCIQDNTSLYYTSVGNVTSFTFDSLRTSGAPWYVINNTDSYRCLQIFNQKIDYLLVQGSGATQTMKDIYDGCVAGGFDSIQKLDSDAFFVKANLNLASNNMIADFRSIDVITLGGLSMTAAGSRALFGSPSPTGVVEGGNWTCLGGQGVAGWSQFTFHDVEMYKWNFRNIRKGGKVNLTTWYVTPTINGTIWKLENVTFDCIQYLGFLGGSEAGSYAKNVQVSQGRWAYNFSSDITNGTLSDIRSIYAASSGYFKGTVTAMGLKVSGTSGAFEIIAINSSVDVETKATLIDSNIDFTKTAPYPIYWYNAGRVTSGNEYVKNMKTQTFLITDAEKNPISAATIKIYIGESLVATLTTDANGLATTILEIGVHHATPGSTANHYGYYTNYNPFTFVITKDGFETENYLINVTDTTHHIQSLKSQISKLEDDNGNVFDRVDKTNSGTTNLRRKLTKVM